LDVVSVKQPRTPTAKVASDHLPVCAQLSLSRVSRSQDL